MEEFKIDLTDDAVEVLRAYQEKGGTFAELVEGMINLAAPYGDPNDNSDIEMARLRLNFPTHKNKP